VIKQQHKLFLYVGNDGSAETESSAEAEDTAFVGLCLRLVDQVLGEISFVQ